MNIEVVTFRAKQGTDDNAMEVAITESWRFLTAQPGFLQRIAGAAAEGEWIDIIVWETIDDAHRAASAFQTAPETRAFARLIDLDTARMAHYAAMPAPDHG